MSRSLSSNITNFLYVSLPLPLSLCLFFSLPSFPYVFLCSLFLFLYLTFCIQFGTIIIHSNPSLHPCTRTTSSSQHPGRMNGGRLNTPHPSPPLRSSVPPPPPLTRPRSSLCSQSRAWRHSVNLHPLFPLPLSRPLPPLCRPLPLSRPLPHLCKPLTLSSPLSQCKPTLVYPPLLLSSLLSLCKPLSMPHHPQ